MKMMLHSSWAWSSFFWSPSRRFALLRVCKVSIHTPSHSPSKPKPPLATSSSTTRTHQHQQLLVLSCFLISSPSREWAQCLIHHCLGHHHQHHQTQPLLPLPTFARSAVAFDRWLSATASSSPDPLLTSRIVTHLLKRQQDPTNTPTETILHTLNLLSKHSHSQSSSPLPITPADYLHTHILPHLTHLLSLSPGSLPSNPPDQHLRRLLTHPLVTSFPSPDLLVTRLHLLAFHHPKARTPPSLAHFPVQAYPLLTSTHINALWTLFTPPVPLRSRTSHRPLVSLWHAPRGQPNPAQLATLVANVPLANWNTTTWILAAHCAYLNPVDVARAYLGMTRVPFMRQASASYLDWIRAPDDHVMLTAATSAGLTRALNPVVRTRTLLVLTVLLERLIQPAGTASTTSGGGSPNYAMADALLDAARGLDWDTRFLNAVLEGYAASGQWVKARYVFEDLIESPDVYTLRVMVKYYARGHEEVGKVLAMVRKRAKGKVEVGVWGGYWLVRSALEGPGMASTDDWDEALPPQLQDVDQLDADGLPALARIPGDASNWATGHAILTHLLTYDPASVLPVTCHLVLRAYARAGQVTKLERLVREMRAKGKVHRETHGLVMMGYVVHMRRWLSPRARYTSGWQADVVRERGFEDVWRVFEEHVAEVARAREAVAASAVHWLLVAHVPNEKAAARSLRVLSEMGVGLDESHLRHLWRLAYRLTTRGKVRASIQEVYARFVRQVRRQFGADPEKVAEWEEWISGYCESRRVFVRPVVLSSSTGMEGEIVEWLLVRLVVD